MTTTARTARYKQRRDDFNRTLLSILPAQGEWGENEYLWLTDRSKRLIEFTDGYIEVLPMPTEKHQAILQFLFLALHAFIQRIGGKVFVAALRLRLRTGKFREPDILLLLNRNDPRGSNAYWTGADLVAEIVSPDDPQHDTIKKRQDYAEAGIPEYWIVNPLEESITVLRLEGASYVEHGVFTRGAWADSVLLQGFTISVDAVLDAE